MKFDFPFVLAALPVLLQGVGVTLTVSLASVVLGVALGLLVALGRLSRRRWLFRLAGVYISFIRGTPLLVQVLLVFLVVPVWLGFDLPPLAAGITAMALNTAAFTGESIRGAVQSLPRGQVEAARALGMSAAQTMRRIVLPQVFAVLLPALTNDLVIIVKASSILSVISVIELTRYGQQMVGTTYKPAEIYVAVALLYLAINLSLSRITAMLERRVALTR